MRCLVTLHRILLHSKNTCHNVIPRLSKIDRLRDRSDFPVMTTAHVFTYHCLCAELLLATLAPLETFPKRESDGATSCRITELDVLDTGPLVADLVVLSNGAIVVADKPIVLRLEDGFEKRYHAQCARCALKVGYWLDWSQSIEGEKGMGMGMRKDALYLLPGGLQSTSDMRDGMYMSARTELAAGDAA